MKITNLKDGSQSARLGKPEAVVMRRSMKVMFLKIPENSQENCCVGISIIKETPAQVFPLNIVKFLRTAFFIDYLWRLLVTFFTIIVTARVKMTC